MAKGAAAVWIARKWGNGGDLLLVLAGMGAIAGHTWTIFLGFRGGKGVATAAGVLFSLVPAETLICLVVFTICVAIGRMISLGSIIASAALPLTLLIGAQLTGNEARPVILWFTVIVALLVILRHRSNMGRIASGTEARFSFRRGEGN